MGWSGPLGCALEGHPHPCRLRRIPANPEVSPWSSLCASHYSSYLISRDVIEPLDGANMMRALQQLVRANEVVPTKLQRVAKAEIDVCLSSEMDNNVDLELPQTAQHILSLRHVAVEEGEVRAAFQHPRVVPRAAVVELVEGDDIVCIRVFGREVPNDPRGTGSVSWVSSPRDSEN